MERFSFPNIVQLVMCQIFILDRLQSTSGLVTLTHNSTLIDPWTFQEGDNVTLTCTIQPYNNFQIWRFNSSSVSSCGLSSCSVTNNKNGNFIFQQNTGTGVFFWHINPMQLEYNNAAFECSDGSPAGTLSKTATVTQRFTKQATTTDSSNVGAIAGGCVGGGIGIILIIGAIFFFTRVAPSEPKEFTADHRRIVRWNRGDNGGLPQTFIITADTRKGSCTFTVKDRKSPQENINLNYYLEQQECLDLKLHASNYRGKSKTVQCHVPGVPCPPTNFQNTKCLNRSVVLEWKFSICGTCKDEQGFTVTVTELKSVVTEPQVESDVNKHFVTSEIQHVAEFATHSFKNLLSGKSYIATLKACNKFGESEKVTTRFKTCDDPKPAKILKMTAETKKIIVKWEAQKGQLTQIFELKYKESNEKTWKCPSTKSTFDKNVYIQEIENLKERTVYQIRIEAENALGTVPVEDEEETRGKPDPPEIISISPISDTQIRITWLCGADGGFPQTFEIKEARKSITLIEDIKYIESSLKMNRVVEGLSPGTHYEFMVGAKNCIDTSWSEKKPIKISPTHDSSSTKNKE